MPDLEQPVTAKLIKFLRESLEIEGMDRDPTTDEIVATMKFLSGPLTLESVCELQAVYAPGQPLRDWPGMDVRVGRDVPPYGGPAIRTLLHHTLKEVMAPYQRHIRFEKLHPFMDGNGRVGRTIWLWDMSSYKNPDMDPYRIPFLRAFYYNTLAVAPRII